VVQKTEGKDSIINDMAAFIKEHHPRDAGIIYAYSKADADTVADKLCERGIIARSYHSV
jgi:ATP-dependent DNA helicase Q1